jgi:iron only hydrogenase large subunit-like protein
MNEIEQLTQLIKEKKHLVAMLAPSFPIVFDYPDIVKKLKQIGFSEVLEVAVGAEITNAQLLMELNSDKKKRFITSPCASAVRLIRKKYPHLEKYLAYTVDSPMVATAKIVHHKWSDAKVVFIGPCIVKRLEASEDHPDLDILVLTYKELNEVFKMIQPDETILVERLFDLENSSTRLYPISGGLAATSCSSHLLASDEVQVISGWKNCAEALDNFEKNTSVRLLDILFCDGGCINGSGIESSLSLDERRNKILSYIEQRKVESSVSS